jgi:hypothetical protein
MPSSPQPQLQLLLIVMSSFRVDWQKFYYKIVTKYALNNGLFIQNNCLFVCIFFPGNPVSEQDRERQDNWGEQNFRSPSQNHSTDLALTTSMIEK